MIVHPKIEHTDTNFQATEGYTNLSIHKRVDGTLDINMSEDDFIEITLTADQATFLKKWINI